MRWTDSRIREALGLPVGANGPEFGGIVTDSRAARSGDLFVALQGERFDGHRFLEAVREVGVRGAVARHGTPPVVGLTLYSVPDTIRGYGLLARARRRLISGPVIAITGTNGKTSTKELLRAAMATRFRVHATRANLNNLVGVPATILEAADGVEALVVEAGANVPGEIARYREIIEPDIAVITNVGPGHLEGFGSLQGVMREKLALVENVEMAVVGTDPPTLAVEARRRAKRVITAGLEGADVVPTSVDVGRDGRVRMVVDGQVVVPGPIGLHQAKNALLVWAVARELGLDLGAVAAALSNVTIPGARGQLVVQGALEILNDSYNANPTSFRAVIETARQLRRGRRMAFVAGTMLELGPDAEVLHHEVAAQLVALEPDLLVAVGAFGPALEPWKGRLGERLVIAPDADSAGKALAARLEGLEFLVLKGSRGVALERILSWLPGHST